MGSLYKDRIGFFAKCIILFKNFAECGVAIYE